jgi:hypothetical protein
MSTVEVEELIATRFRRLLRGDECIVREQMLRSVRAHLVELDALERHHPIWIHLHVQTVNESRLRSYLNWKLYHKLAGQDVYWAMLALDLHSGSTSIRSWEGLWDHPDWSLDWPLLEGLFNLRLFPMGNWLGELRTWLENRGWYRAALERLGDSAILHSPCSDFFLAEVEATDEDIPRYRDLLSDIRPEKVDLPGGISFNPR